MKKSRSYDLGCTLKICCPSSSQNSNIIAPKKTAERATSSFGFGGGSTISPSSPAAAKRWGMRTPHQHCQPHAPVKTRQCKWEVGGKETGWRHMLQSKWQEENNTLEKEQRWEGWDVPPTQPLRLSGVTLIPTSRQDHGTHLASVPLLCPKVVPLPSTR
jgi:hypothetical protein